MQDINRVTVVGRLTRDAELAYITGANGYPILKFSVASNWRKKKREGGWQEEVSYFDISLFGKMGETIASYAIKGRRVVVDGRLRQSRWADRQGNKHSKVYIEASHVQLTDGKQQSSGQQSSGQQPHGQQSHRPQGYLQQGYPRQRQPQQNRPQQGWPQQGPSQQGRPQQGQPQQGQPQEHDFDDDDIPF